MLSWMFPPKPKKLGPIEVGYVEDSVRFAERKHEADAMPQLIQYNFVAASWILAKRPKPSVGRSRLGGVR